MWAIRGSKPILPIYGSRARLNVIGAIDSINDKGYFAYIKNLNAKLFESFLRGLLKFYPGPGKIYMFLDNASSHHAKSLKPFLKGVQDKFELVFLPPYSPELSEIEQVWFLIKEEVVYNGFFKSFNEFKGALTRALRRMRDSNGAIRSVCNIEKFIEVET